MSTAIRTLQAVTAQSSIADKAAAREDKSAAKKDTKKAIETIHQQRTIKAEEEAQAIRDEFGGRFWGTIIGGPLIGTLIGWGIGAAASNNNDDNAAAAEKKAGLADLERATANDSLQDANEDIDNAKTNADQLDQFMSEIRQHDTRMGNETV